MTVLFVITEVHRMLILSHLPRTEPASFAFVDVVRTSESIFSFINYFPLINLTVDVPVNWLDANSEGHVAVSVEYIVALFPVDVVLVRIVEIHQLHLKIVIGGN